MTPDHIERAGKQSGRIAAQHFAALKQFSRAVHFRYSGTYRPLGFDPASFTCSLSGFASASQNCSGVPAMWIRSVLDELAQTA
jgi:hypothetical protein